MSMSTRSADTSVTFSLAELAQLERERLDDEERVRAQERAEQARRAREDEARRRDAESRARVADEETKARRAREEAAERVRVEAREESAREVARIEAEGRARLAADDAGRAHELAVLRVRAESGHRRLQVGLAVALLVVASVAGAGGVRAAGQIGALERDAERLRDGQASLMRERDAAKAAEVAALDRRFAHLRAQPLASAAGVREARATAESARAAIDAKAPDHAKVAALADALDVLELRTETLGRIAALEKREDDLLALSGARRAGEAVAAIEKARAEAGRSEESLRVYERALDAARDELARRPGRAGPRPPREAATNSGEACLKGDPLCGLDGRRL